MTSNQHPHRPRPYRRPRPTPHRYRLLALGWLLALASFSLELRQWFRAEASAQRDLCQEVTQPTAVLSRQQLASLLTVPERAKQAAVRTVVETPYCTLSPLEVRAGVQATREAYPLAFDPDTWLIVLYEGEEYAGYAFAVQ